MEIVPLQRALTVMLTAVLGDLF